MSVKIGVLCAVLGMAIASGAQDAPAKPSDADARARVDAWNLAVKNKNDDEKIAALTAMGDCAHPTVAGTLAKVLVSEKEDIRIQAAKSLGRMTNSADAAKACHGAIKANAASDKVVTAIFEAMGEINHPSSVGVAKDWAEDDLGGRDSQDIPTIRAGVECLGALKWKSAVEAILDVWRKNRVVGRDPASNFREKVRKYCVQALQRQVGERLGNYEEADDWWKKNSKTFNADMTTR
ncbi:MAG: HEAT repeat domain-containing protein [Candidatus Brocadiae bacterium]|nr:HEAT repeat domain-containing protein [Candidatus Brocadiia bacterium]